MQLWKRRFFDLTKTQLNLYKSEIVGPFNMSIPEPKSIC